MMDYQDVSALVDDSEVLEPLGHQAGLEPQVDLEKMDQDLKGVQDKEALQALADHQVAVRLPGGMNAAKEGTDVNRSVLTPGTATIVHVMMDINS